MDIINDARENLKGLFSIYFLEYNGKKHIVSSWSWCKQLVFQIQSLIRFLSQGFILAFFFFFSPSSWEANGNSSYIISLVFSLDLLPATLACWIVLCIFSIFVTCQFSLHLHVESVSCVPDLHRKEQLNIKYWACPHTQE